MADLNSFDALVLRLLHKKVETSMTEHATGLATGSARANDANTTAAQYCEAIGYMRALSNVLDWAKDIEDEIAGRKSK